MNMRHYEPWGVLNQLSREMNSLFPKATGATGEPGDMAASDWTPAVDVREEAGRFVIHADVPGVDPEKIDVHMEGGVLSIRGERSAEDTREAEGFKRVERFRGTFLRRFSLPESTDADNITATSRNGVLEIVIPKQEKVQPRRITIQG